MEHSKKNKIRIIVVFASLFIAVSTLLLLIFFAGKKTYTVTFDLNGGTLLSGSLTQHVIRGQNASPPKTVKDGAYFLTWSESYNGITKDVVIEAIWEYETTPGIIYSEGENQNFTEIVGAYKYLSGEVYIGAFHDKKKVLGIKSGAFADCTDITKVYLLDGLLVIEDKAFSGCTSLKEIEIPETVSRLCSEAFSGCTSLEKIVLKEGLKEIGAGAFAGCTSLKEIVIPESVEKIDKDAFLGCEGLVIKTTLSEDEMPEGWCEGWSCDAEVVWGMVVETPKDESEKEE